MAQFDSSEEISHSLNKNVGTNLNFAGSSVKWAQNSGALDENCR